MSRHLAFFLLFLNIFHNNIFLKCGVRASITIALSSVAENESQRNIKSLVLE